MASHVPSLCPATLEKSADTSRRAGWGCRLLAVAFYLGLLPLLRPRGCRHDDPFVHHHAAQALALILLLLALLAGGLLYWALLTSLILYGRDLYASLPSPADWPTPLRDGLPLGAALLPWLLAWVWCLALAASGSARDLPLVRRLAGRPRLLQLAWLGNVLLGAGALLTAAAAGHASSLARDDDGPAAVYVLYDDMGFVPRWVFSLGFYRVSLAATERWGPGSVVVAPLDEAHLRSALRHGRFVFLACHGRGGDIETAHLRISPSAEPARGLCVTREGDPPESGAADTVQAGENLRLVYNAACDGGSKAPQWERALAPAEVRTFDRLSTVAEHVAWLWLTGPDRVRSLR